MQKIENMTNKTKDKGTHDLSIDKQKKLEIWEKNWKFGKTFETWLTFGNWGKIWKFEKKNWNLENLQKKNENLEILQKNFGNL